MVSCIWPPESFQYSRNFHSWTPEYPRNCRTRVLLILFCPQLDKLRHGQTHSESVSPWTHKLIWMIATSSSRSTDNSLGALSYHLSGTYLTACCVGISGPDHLSPRIAVFSLKINPFQTPLPSSGITKQGHMSYLWLKSALLVLTIQVDNT